MEKRFYYSPEMKFHMLRGKSSMLASTTQEEAKQGHDDEDLAMGFGSFYFDEDED